MSISPDNPFALLRSWLFVPGADRNAMNVAHETGADVIVQELEDFTPPARRAEARGYSKEVFETWRQHGVVPAVRINPLESGGFDDLQGVMPGRPDIVMISKAETASQIGRLDVAIGEWEETLGIPAGSTRIVPNVESALGVINTHEIVRSSRRVQAVLVGTEDMVVDLGADRSREGTELFYARSRFLFECAAAGVLAIDLPYTFSDPDGAEADMRVSRSIGYKAKAVVNGNLVVLTNRSLTPSAEQVALATEQVAAFDAAHRRGESRAEVGGLVVEYPSYFAAKRLLERHALLQQSAQSRRSTS